MARTKTADTKPKKETTKKKKAEPKPKAARAKKAVTKEATAASNTQPPEATAASNTRPPEATAASNTQPPEATAAWTVSRLLKVTVPLMKGEDVRALQTALIAAGYPCGIAGATGIYGKETAWAVRRYQACNRLIVDGRAGKYTVKALGGVWQPEAAEDGK